MFTSSLSRVVRSSQPHSLSSSFTSWASTNSVAASTIPTLCRRHQRRQSSSKASNPPDGGSRNLGAPAETSKPATPATKSNLDKNATARLGRRRGKDVAVEAAGKATDDPALNIPSVPSTQHRHPHGNGRVVVRLTGALMLTLPQTSRLPPSSPSTVPFPLPPPSPQTRLHRHSLAYSQHARSRNHNPRMSSTPCLPPSTCSSPPRGASNPNRRPNRRPKRWSYEQQSPKPPSATPSPERNTWTALRATSSACLSNR